MGMWSEYCLVCGGPPYTPFDDTDEGKTESSQSTAADYNWLENFVGISHTDEVIPLNSYDFYGSFTPETDEKYLYFDIGCRSDQYREKEAHGYACHANCYRLLQRELNYSLRFQDVRPLLSDCDWCSLNKFAWSDYGGLSEYQEEDFCETQLAEDGKLWMIEDPMTNAANAARIVELWRPLVQNGFQRPVDRSPSCRDAAPERDARHESTGAEMRIDDSEQ